MPMREEDWIRTICQAPDDDSPRLIYADWLEERNKPGDAERAEFIRIQCQSAACTVCDGSGNNVMSPWGCSRRKARQQQLIVGDPELGALAPSNLWKWSGGILAWASTTNWKRGFIHSVVVTFGDLWVTKAEEALRFHPIREVALWVLPTIERSFGPFADGRCIASIRGTNKPMGVPNDEWLASRQLLSHCWPGIRFDLPPHRSYQ